MQGVSDIGLGSWDVVGRLQIVALLAKAFLVTCARKRDSYRVWMVCQDHMRALFRTLLPLIEGFYMGQVLNGYQTVHMATAFEVELEALRGDDDLWMVSSNTYVSLAEANSDNNDNCERWFHWESFRWVQRECRMVTREYLHFSI